MNIRLLSGMASVACALMLSLSSFAQDQTFSFSKASFSNETGTVLLVPWEEKMYISDINREVNYRTGLEIDEIKRLFREGFCQLFAQEASEKWDVVDLVTGDVDGHLSDLEYIHRSVSYSYVNVPPPPPENKAQELLTKFSLKKPKEQKGRGVNVEQGQLSTYYDKNERFMTTRVNNEELLPYLLEKYDYELIVLINELDIRVLRDHNMERGQTWDRRIKVHYSVFDKEGNELVSNAAFAEFGGEEKDIYAIIRRNFSTPVRTILEQIDLAQAEEATAESETEDDDDY